jgi:aminomethyltransferase
MPKRTPLYQEHVKLNAKMVDFAGWEMPVSYSGIIEEHLAVRNSAGLFDVGHMGIAEISGEGALPFLQKITTNDASKLEEYKAQYSILLNDGGGVIDDVLVFRLPEKYVLVLNASNTEKDLAWLKKNARGKVKTEHKSKTHIISLQGPKSELILSPNCDINLKLLKHNQCSRAMVFENECLVSRTGYTGEGGFELFVPANDAAGLWRSILEAGKPIGLLPCGLGARDSLRIEAALPLYGHEYAEEISPLEAGYGWAVKFDKGAFIGKEALLKRKEKLDRKLVGIVLKERAIPRHGFKVFSDGGMKEAVGEITSGVFSPTLQRSIGMAYIDARRANDGSPVWVAIRNRPFEGTIANLPFYKRKT